MNKASGFSAHPVVGHARVREGLTAGGVQSRVWMALQVWAACPSVCSCVGHPASFQDTSLELGRAPSLWGFPRAAAGLGQQGHWVTFSSVPAAWVPQSARGFGSRVTDSRRLGFSAFPAASLCNVCLRCRARADRPGAGGSLGECDRAPPHTPGHRELAGGGGGGRRCFRGQPWLSGGR